MLYITIVSKFLLFIFFFFNDTATTEIYTLSLHDALPIYGALLGRGAPRTLGGRVPFRERQRASPSSVVLSAQRATSTQAPRAAASSVASSTAWARIPSASDGDGVVPVLIPSSRRPTSGAIRVRPVTSSGSPSAATVGGGVRGVTGVSAAPPPARSP